MNFTHAQISEILLDLANSDNGLELLMKMVLETLMKSERELHRLSNPTDYANGYRPRKTNAFGKEIALKVPRTRSGSFYPVLLSVINDEQEEQRKLIFSLYSKGLTTEQVSDIYDELYGKTYSKQQISYLMKDSKAEIDLWLKRGLDEHYLAFYIDATFVHTRRDHSVSKEGYFTILGVKEDGSREVLSIVNHPTEGALLWENELNALKARGVKSVGLIVSDGLTSIENAIAKAFPGSKHQLCVVHFKRNILAVFPKTKRSDVAAKLNEIFPMETKSTSPIDAFKKLCNFVEANEKSYPALAAFKNERNIAYFTYLEYPTEIQRMIYSTNWIERLNRDYKRVLKMRGAMPTASSVISLMGAVALEKEDKTYKYPVHAFKNVQELQRPNINH
jgi:putative transposase